MTKPHSKSQTTDLRPALTNHARRRMAQRNLGCKDIEYIMAQGRTIHRSGAVFVHLCLKDIPAEDQADATIARLEGATIVLDNTETVILTVWRNRNQGSRHIGHKREYNQPRVSIFRPLIDYHPW